MGHSASLDIAFHPGNLYPSTLIRALLSHGWSVNDGGVISHSRSGVDNWEDAPLERLEEVLDALDAEWDTGEPVAIVLMKEEAGSGIGGGSFLFWNEDKISVLANVARRTLERAQNFTDLSWYVERILPALSSLHQDVESLTTSEHV
jgi:hypothetical protein